MDWELDGFVILVGVLSATSCALLGNYLVLRKMSLMGDAISHAVLPGLAVAFLISESRAAVPMFLGAVVAGGLTAVLAQAIQRYGKVESGAAMGVIFSILFAVGLILIRQTADRVHLDAECVLYGDIESIALAGSADVIPQQVINLTAVLVLNVLFVGLFYKELKISAFDPELATTLGINAGAMHYALMLMVAITTVANFEAVGSILVIAMLIVPPVTAYLLTDRLGVMIALSVLVAAAAAVLGRVMVVAGVEWFGPQFDTKTSALMAVLAGVFLFITLFVSPQYGLISRLYHRASLGLQILRQDVLGLLYRGQELAADPSHAMSRAAVVRVVGDSLLAKWAIRSLVHNRLIEPVNGAASDRSGHRPELLRLTARGLGEAARLVRSHRLWESYLDKYFDLPLDHLHLPAERVEHFISDEMRDRLHADLTEPAADPHGRQIPRQPDA